ncbi:DsrE family protein [Nioella nitratireducens]|uniref:DsrE family protein n=1 Tax=Nioella nitratireducens TaxID=1287720 RepID=UPI0008FD0CC9|nr:DsrE family protein [Nioella nitratireducens]
MKKMLVSAALVAMSTCGALAEGVAHHVAIHVDQNDPQVMNMALNNAVNVSTYYAAQGDTVEIELVAYGPGLNMLIPGRSPVADRIETMTLGMDNLAFSACGNTHRRMSEAAGEEVPLFDGVSITPSGVVRLIELQEDGYAYIRP